MKYQCLYNSKLTWRDLDTRSGSSPSIGPGPLPPTIESIVISYRDLQKHLLKTSTPSFRTVTSFSDRHNSFLTQPLTFTFLHFIIIFLANDHNFRWMTNILDLCQSVCHFATNRRICKIERKARNIQSEFIGITLEDDRCNKMNYSEFWLRIFESES